MDRAGDPTRPALARKAKNPGIGAILPAFNAWPKPQLKENDYLLGTPLRYNGFATALDHRVNLSSNRQQVNDLTPYEIPKKDDAKPSSPVDGDSGSDHLSKCELTIRRIDVADTSEPDLAESELGVTALLSPGHRHPLPATDVGTKVQAPDRKPQRRRSRRPDPITQSLMLLATMAVMLVAARFAVPRIVEEIRYSWHRGELRAEYESGTEGLRNVSLDALSEAYQMVTAAVGPSVVHIDINRRPVMNEAPAGNLLSNRMLPATDQGSGVVVDSAGYVLTNRHVVADGEQITVTLSDGRRVPGEIVGTDELTDLALLRIEADRLLPIAWGDSDRCKVGSPVWAVGSPFGLDRTVTFGILSGKHRMVRASTRYQDFMQSDVAVNPGNSGGPLVDARGTLVGINTAIVGDTYQGVSFSIPSNVAKQVYQRLRETGRVERAWLGVALTEVSDDQHTGDDPRMRGAIVTALTNNLSPAAMAGLEMGDLIQSVDGKLVRDMGHLMRMIGDAKAGSSVDLGIRRGDATMQIEVVLGSRPPEWNVQ